MSKKATDQPEYSIWGAMKQRCLNSNNSRYHDYGGRGIGIHPSWVESFWTFLEDMGSRPSSDYSIDRKDNDGDYTPKNCRWATRREQHNNRNNNNSVTFRGKTQTLTEWSRELGVERTTLRWRLDNGWSAEKTFTRGRYKRSFSEEDEREIKKRAEAGETPASIAKDYEVSRLTVWRFLTGKKG